MLHETRSPEELRAKKRGPRGAQMALLGADGLTGKTSNQRQYEKNADAERERSRLYKLEHPDVGWTKTKAYRKTESGRAALRRGRLKEKYGLTLEQWDALLAAQGGRCAICRTDSPGKRGFFVDHVHGTKLVRGLLCHSCNAAIGLLRDDPTVAEGAAAYLRANRAAPEAQ